MSSKPRKRDHVKGRWQFYLFVRTPEGSTVEVDNALPGAQNDTNDDTARALFERAIKP